MEKDAIRTVQSGCGDQSQNLLLQWTFTIISSLATDMWMESALRDFFVWGLVILWTACPLKWQYCPCLSGSERVGLWTEMEDTLMFLLLFFYEEEKYLFTNLDSFCPVCFYVTLFFLFFTRYHNQTMLQIYHTLKGRKRILNWCYFLLVMVKFWIVKLYHTSTKSRFWGIYGSDPDSYYRLTQLWTWTHSSRAVCAKKQHLF